MANTAQTNTPIIITTTAGFNAWFNEIITQLLGVGLTQTTDTGQISTGGAVAIPGTTLTAAGYTIWRFNDTLQSTSPVFFKLEFGVGSALADPAIWITIGTGSNGSGTITAPTVGAVGTRRMCTPNTAPISSVTNYVSSFLYNPTLGLCGLVSKQGAVSAAYASIGGFYIYRSNNSSGAATGDSINLLTNASAANTGAASSGGFQECVSYLTNLVYGVGSGGPPQTPSGIWSSVPMAAAATASASTNYNSKTQAFSVTYMTPTYAISAFAATGLTVDFTLGSQYSMALVGGTPINFLAVGTGAWGSTDININGGVVSGASYTFLMPWQ